MTAPRKPDNPTSGTAKNRRALPDNPTTDPDRLAFILEAAGVETWDWDITQGTLVWSDGLKQMFGLSPTDKVTYERYQSLLHPDDRQYVEASIAASIASRKKYRIEHRVVWPNGEIHWILGQGQAIFKDGKAIRMVGANINIDERRAATTRLQESEHRFRGLADSAPVLIWMTNADKSFNYFNKAWLHFTGRSLNEEIGNGWIDGIHPDDIHDCIAMFAAAFDAREPYSMEFRLRYHDSTYRWIMASGSPRFLGNHEFLGYIGSCTDIDGVKRGRELERMNALLKKQRAQLVAINDAKDEFISIASHQLRTPASAVKQYVGLLLQGYVGDLTDMQQKMVTAAYTSNERQLRIIEDLLRVAQVDAGKIILNRQPTNIVRLLDDVIQEQQAKFNERQQNLKYTHAAKTTEAAVDQRLLRMVLENLIDNAGKYSPTGKIIYVNIRRKAGSVLLAIQDQGVGISAQDQKKLFQKFSRLTNPLSTLVSGSGLGLYWAKKIIDLHGGTITVDSAEGAGTTFTITLPTA